MTLRIISAEEIVYEGRVNSVTLPGSIGAFTVLKNHASLVSTLVSGEIIFTDENAQEHRHSISGGIADVDNNIVSVCLY